MFRCLFLLVSTFQAAFGSIQNCGKDTSLFQITDLSLTPDPPVKGKEVELAVTFNNPGFSVVSGTCESTVTLNFVQFPESIKPLCESTLCPLDMGDNKRIAKSIWPDNVSGFIKSKLEWFNDKNEQLLCIELTAKITGSAFKNSIGFYNKTDTTLIDKLLDLNYSLFLEQLGTDSNTVLDSDTGALLDYDTYSSISDTLNYTLN
jgi:hypothetical protein